MKKNAIQIAIFVTGSCGTLAAMVLILRLVISIYVFTIKGKFIFGVEDLVYSSKAGLAAGIPLGIGSWVLTKIEEYNNQK
ncbi:hypothetical protein [Pandoraea bronchicola]|uniref:hypothetical protein n=1 Tax=Pandoraea bronchicola TaxID=2508287 RepID=UPI00123FB696|nr:hypothetical protein [Pandoraea bronchicola]